MRCCGEELTKLIREETKMVKKIKTGKIVGNTVAEQTEAAERHVGGN